MLSKDELDQWCKDVNLPPEARGMVTHIRTSPPSRRPQSHGGNTTGFFPSEKMQVGVWFESRTVEKVAALQEYETNPEVLEYYHQPPCIKLLYAHGGSKKQVGVLHWPDFFVIRRDSAGWEEWKPEDRLVELAGTAPGRYQQQEGKWMCPPGIEYATPFGCYYALRSSKELNPILHRNLTFLAPYWRPDCPSVSQETKQEILRAVSAQPGITVKALLATLTKVGSEEVNICLVLRVLYADLTEAPLVDQDRVHLFKDRETSQAYLISAASTPTFPYEPPSLIDLSAGQSLMWDGKLWRVANVGQTTITLLAEDGALVEMTSDQVETCLRRGSFTGVAHAVESRVHQEVLARLVRARDRDLKEANHRYAVIEHLVKPGAAALPGDTTPARTKGEWVAQYLKAEQAYGNGYLGLIAQHQKKGNRTARISEAVLALIHDTKKLYLHPTRKKRRAIYLAVKALCKKKGLSPPSYDCVRLAINHIPPAEATEAREGRTAAYRFKAPYLSTDLYLLPHGDLPFEMAHLDHTLLDIEPVDDVTGQLLRRPWLTLLFDARTRRVLAAHLSFDPPSYASCMMAMRICVKRYGRLPQTVVVDRGKEFQSVAFETFLTYHRVGKLERPPKEPRYGSPQERYFGTMNQSFLYNLPGNTQNSKVPRQMTTAVNPRTHACWPPVALFRRLCEWFYDVYDTTSHPDLCETPRAAFERLMVVGGPRKHLRVIYNDVFYILTLPTTPKGTAKIQPGRGVKVRRIYYWAKEFQGYEGKVVPVRYDPFNRGVAYAYVGDAQVGDRWVRGVSAFYSRFAGRTDIELRFASEQHTARLAVHDRDRRASEEELARWLADLDAESEQYVEILCQRQNKKLLAFVEGGSPRDLDDQSGGGPLPADSPYPTLPPPAAVPRPVLRLVKDPPPTYGDY